MLLALLTVAGAVVALRSTSVRPFLLAALVFLALFVLAASYDTPLSARLTAIWWNDRWRLAALYVVPAAVLAAVGLTWVRDRLAELVARVPRSVPLRGLAVRGPAVVGALVLVLAVGTHWGYPTHNMQRVAVPYTDGPTVSAGEQTAYDELARLWHGGTILNDPGDGSPWAYALHGLPLVFKTPLTAPTDPAYFGDDRNALLDHFSDRRTSPAVVEAIRDLDVRWVLVGDGFAAPTLKRAPGLDNLAEVPGLELVWSNDVASIYRVGRDVR